MLCMLHRHVGLSRPFYVNKIYSFIHDGPPIKHDTKKSIKLLAIYYISLVNLDIFPSEWTKTGTSAITSSGKHQN